MPASVLSDFNKTNYELHLPMVLSMMKACALIVKGLNLSFFFHITVFLHYILKWVNCPRLFLLLFFTRIYNVTHGLMKE